MVQRTLVHRLAVGDMVIDARMDSRRNHRCRPRVAAVVCVAGLVAAASLIGAANRVAAQVPIATDQVPAPQSATDSVGNRSTESPAPPAGDAGETNAGETVVDQPATGQPSRTRSGERTLQYWASQLSHERYLRRQSARRHLIDGGLESIPVLRDMLDAGDLETVENVISILAKVAEDEPPWQKDGALATLESIAETSFGTKATLAESTLQSFAETRGREARVQLADAGIFVGTETVALASRSSPREIVRIDSQFNGDRDVLAWLRWIREIDFVVIEATEATSDILGAVMKMPDLATLVIVDCQLTPGAVQAMQTRARLDTIELRYVRLNEDLLTELSQVRLRDALHLMGTGVSEQRAERLRVEMPGLEITLRRGGFLGVMCQTTLQDTCEVSQVTPGSGAADAGLQAGDVVIRIDDVKITRFDDLQRQINTHIPGDEIAIRYRRGEAVFDTTATLKKQRTP
ncbi:serine endoprotease [Stieleria maiorica]|uniref:Serine endoprotease n=2 Tax=Stieleria maiorica TaxID=2795974 RepID=A0A5B9MER0_9BACT|nr:serine endoprotease [Stieleria maiorica]